MLNGLQMLWVVYEHFRLDVNKGHYFSWTDLNKCVFHGDLRLSEFINNWQDTMEGLITPIPEEIIEAMFYEQIKSSTVMKVEIHNYIVATVGHPHKTYKFECQHVRITLSALPWIGQELSLMRVETGQRHSSLLLHLFALPLTLLCNRPPPQPCLLSHRIMLLRIMGSPSGRPKQWASAGRTCRGRAPPRSASTSTKFPMPKISRVESPRRGAVRALIPLHGKTFGTSHRLSAGTFSGATAKAATIVNGRIKAQLALLHL